MPAATSDAVQRMLSFWAKSGRDGDAGSMHGVFHHGLDVAACASALLPCFPPPVRVPPMWIVTMVALHDAGKFTRNFQAKVPALWPDCLGRPDGIPAGWPHDSAGYALLRSYALRERLDPLFEEDWLYGERDPLLRAISGHHGRPPVADDAPDVPEAVACAACREAIETFVTTVLALFEPPPLRVLEGHERAALSWWLAGFTTLADWIGSSRAWFPAPGVTAEARACPGEYWRIAVAQAGKAVASSGLVPARWSDAGGMAGLFPQRAATSRPLQRWAETVRLPQGPALFIVEDATGAGKTEAALVLAHRLVGASRARGIFFALPTTATADAMFRRMEDACERLFAPGGVASLVLAHGRRRLNPHFTDSILQDAAAAAPLEGEDPASQSATAQCAAWIADDRRKCFLAAIGVGTIDQAWLAVLPSRHAMLRLLGLAQHVLIVDEAHGYDGYEGEELARLLAFHAALGGSAIVLSATLTAAQRGVLATSFRRGVGAPAGISASSASYPLATIVGREEASCEPVPMEPSLVREIAVERAASPEAAAEAIAAAMRAGGAVAWIRNAVDDVFEADALLQERGCVPLLFHARFAAGDRLAVEAEVLRRTGARSTPADRRGFVLLATQVLQESLDCDFDLMVSDLAPADLVIQRAGRLWRHRDRRERPLEGPRLLLLSPEPVGDPPVSWLGPHLRRTGMVYADHALLWRSARALLGAGRIATPGNLRELVESAYDRDGVGAVPPGLAASDIRATGSVAGNRAVARQNLLRFEEPYERRAGLWEPDHRTPTRLADPTTRLRLARVEGARVVPWCPDDDPARAWALSEVSVRSARIRSAAPGPADPLIAALKERWTLWERDLAVIVLEPLHDGGENVGWVGAATGPDSRVALGYDTRRGLRLGVGA